MSGADRLRDLSPVSIAGLAAIAAFLFVVAVGVQLAARRLRRELAASGVEELVDPATGLLPREALPVRLGAELAWGGVTGTPIAVAALRIRGSRFPGALGVLRHSMREGEQAFTLGEQRIAVELWGADPDAAVLATRRLGRALAAAGHPVVDAGVACAPRDATDPGTLVDLALRDLRPVDDPIAPGRGTTALRRLLGVLPGFVALLVVVATCWRLVPAAVEPALDGVGRHGSDLLTALVAVLGIPLAAGVVHVAAWNAPAAGAPRSHPFSRAGARAGALVALAVAAPLAWATFAPDATAGLPTAFGLQLALLALVVVALLHARQLVHLPVLLLLVVIAAGGALVWAGVDAAHLPALAAVGRIVFAAGLGALLARSIERASWLAGLALLAGAVDLWSVFADSGLTNRLLDPDASSDTLVQHVLFRGPHVAHASALGIGTTDLVFVAVFLAWSHDWRLDLRVVTPLLGLALWLTAATAYWADRTLPALPALAVVMLVVLAGRSSVLRKRTAAWRGERPPE